jgi:hypothetical protein
MRLHVEELEQRLLPARPYGTPFPAADLLFETALVHFTANQANAPYDQFKSVLTTRNADNNDAVKSALGDILWWTTDKTTGQTIPLQTTNSVANGGYVVFGYNQGQTLQNAQNALGAKVLDHNTQNLLSSTSWSFGVPGAGLSLNAGDYADAVATITGDNTNDKIWSQVRWSNGTANPGTMELDYYDPNTSSFAKQGSWTGYDQNWVGLDRWYANIPRTDRFPNGSGSMIYRIEWKLTAGDASPATRQIDLLAPGGGQSPRALRSASETASQGQSVDVGSASLASGLQEATGVLLASTAAAPSGRVSAPSDAVENASVASAVAQTSVANSTPQSALQVLAGAALSGAATDHGLSGNPLSPPPDALDFVLAGALLP